jgi:hypothetical protein
MGVADRFAQIPGEAEAVLARHHHVEDDEVEIEPRQQAPRMGRVAGSRGHEAVAHEELLQQPANAFVVVDDQEVRADIHHARHPRREVVAAHIRIHHLFQHRAEAGHGLGPRIAEGGAHAGALRLGQLPLQVGPASVR